jgi:UDP-glucose 4-epimerase
MPSRRLMVCGGAGFVGSHLVDRLLAEGHEVDVVDDLSTGSLTNLSEARAATGRFKFQHLATGAREFTELVSLRRPEVIFNLCCLTPSQSQLSGAMTSMSSAVTILEAARLSGVTKVVTAEPSTMMYGDVAARDIPIKEGHLSEPRLATEVVARAIADMHSVYRELHAIEFTLLAIGTVYGPRQRPEDGVVAAFLHALEEGKAPIIHGTGKQTRDFIYIDDVVDALVRSLDRAGGLVVNIGTGEQVSIRDLWAKMAGASALTPHSSSARPHDVVRLALSPVRARIQLGWSPFTPLDQGLALLRS